MVWVHNHNTYVLQPFLPNKQQFKGIPGRDVLKTNTLKCKRNLFGPLSSQKPKNKVESAKVKTECRLYFSLLFSKGSATIYRLRGGGDFWGSRGLQRERWEKQWSPTE